MKEKRRIWVVERWIGGVWVTLLTPMDWTREDARAHARRLRAPWIETKMANRIKVRIVKYVPEER